ncbi:MAG: c-type cytochrome biogenesis protein CcmI [Betaproteobacteria bacterium]|nr:c-type cytochrome biogenesis protein CcmI [Betaproteobacteria bacterium]
MTVFWVISALLAAAALLFVVPPLFRRRERARVSRSATNLAIHRDQLRELDADLAAGTLNAEQHEKARRELEARLLEEVAQDEAAAPAPHGRKAAIAAGIAVPLCAIAVYFFVGSPGALAPEQAGDAGHGLTAAQVEAMVERLAIRMRDHPDDPEGWILLGRSYGALGRFADSAQAYANAVARRPNDAQLLADYADTLAMAQGQRLQGEPERLIARALEIDPRNLKALALAGTVAFEKQDYAGAVRLWERMLPLVPQGSEAARSIMGSIDEARTLGASAGAGSAPGPALAARKSGVSGVVKLAPELAGKVAPTDTVFIFARAAEGPRMPLAIARRQARDLPAEFTLDDTMAMQAGVNLSSAPQVVIGARISRSANATPRPGDLQGLSPPVRNDASGISVVINAEIR